MGAGTNRKHCVESPLRKALEASKIFRTQAEAARYLGIPRTTYRDRLQTARETSHVKGRHIVDLDDGIVLVGGDAHYWPGAPSTAHKAFVKFCTDLKPDIVVMNGDVLDASSISRHPPIGWNRLPSVKEEIDTAIERLDEIVAATPNAPHLWPLGNHDARLETRLAQVAPELKDVYGTSLNDHFPDWQGCWSVHINDRPGGVVVTHRFKGGMHAPQNNALWAGRSIVTGHLHSLKVMPVSDYNGTRFGVDAGCLAEPYHDAFQDYTEDAPKNWRSGFVVLTFKRGHLLWPEVCHVIEPGIVEFRGELITV